MFVVNDDLSIYATRGDIVCLNVSATDDSTGGAYEFQPGDIVRMKIFGKKDAENVVMQKDFPVIAKADSVAVFLSEEDTKIGDVISKPKDYWYEIELNPYTNPQTIVGYDEDGAKIFKLFPEGKDLKDEPTEPEDIPVVDTDLDLTSSRPVENKAIARAVTLLKNDLEAVDKRLTAKIKENRDTGVELNEKITQNRSAVDQSIAVERARIDQLITSPSAADAELTDIRVGADGVTYVSAGTAVREQFHTIHDSVFTQIVFDDYVGYRIGRDYIDMVEGFSVSNPIPVTEGMDVYLKTNTVNPYVARFGFSVSDDVNVPIMKTVYSDAPGWVSGTAPEGAKYLFVSSETNMDGVTSDIPPVLYISTANAVNTLKSNVSSLNERITDIENVGVKLELPASYELVVGDTFELFWKGVIHSTHPENYYVKVKCSKGIAYRRKFVCTPISSDVGTHVMTVELYDDCHVLCDRKSVNLVVKSKATTPNEETVVLYVGDSLANGGYVPDEFYRRLTDTNGKPVGDGMKNISFIGDNFGVTNGTPYVGNGGWTFDSYNSSMQSDAYMWITCSSHGKTEGEDQHSVYQDSNGVRWKLETIEVSRIKLIRIDSAGTLPNNGVLTWISGGEHTGNIVYTDSEKAAGNPFWNDDTDSVDFADFVSRHGKTTLNYVYVLLGWNNAGTSEAKYKESVRQFISNVFASFQNCKIVLLGLQIPAFDGLAHNYGANTTNYSEYDVLLDYVFNINKWYEDIAEEFANVTYANVSGQFDTDNNMPSSLYEVNVRNSNTEVRQTNGVHPSIEGYYQIADVCYRDFVHKLQ